MEGINLAIAPGERLVPSGCGKTTTLRMVVGFIQPGGEFLLNGRQVADARFYAAAVILSISPRRPITLYVELFFIFRISQTALFPRINRYFYWGKYG
ncbi:ATP-binding cassette domain-containing protein [Sodalis sp. C49]|uniref:ATP-binding cassette domain-containing protein n=1 Tax=unclassified Sodalis (in: enterobacteria) TaxID=2636512 RepID=UPI003965A7B8